MNLISKLFIVALSAAIMVWFTPTFSDVAFAKDKSGFGHHGDGHDKGKGKGHHDHGNGKGKGHDKNGCPDDPDDPETPDGPETPESFEARGIESSGCDTDWERATLEECKGLPYRAYK